MAFGLGHSKGLNDLPFGWNAFAKPKWPGVDGYKDDKYFLALQGKTSAESYEPDWMKNPPKLFEGQLGFNTDSFKTGVAVLDNAWRQPPPSKYMARQNNALFNLKAINGEDAFSGYPQPKNIWNGYQVGPPGHFEDMLNLLRHATSGLERAMAASNLAQQQGQIAFSKAHWAATSLSAMLTPPELAEVTVPPLPDNQMQYDFTTSTTDHLWNIPEMW